MTSNIGKTPPLHRRYNEENALEHIANRYRKCKKDIYQQVRLLQSDPLFRKKCEIYYKKGYKDWVILGAIYNCILNWMAREKEISFNSIEDSKKFIGLQDEISKKTYPSSDFMGEDMDMQVNSHILYVLPTYGFNVRRHDIYPQALEEFLRVRMRHFDFDLPHNPLFGDPPGNWPNIPKQF